MTLSGEKLLDDIGWQLLAAFQKSAHTPFSELGRQVGLSAPAVTERVPHLERVITSFKPYGAPVTSLILSSPVPARGAQPPGT